jgi:hypothetical protein
MVGRFTKRRDCLLAALCGNGGKSQRQTAGFLRTLRRPIDDGVIEVAPGCGCAIATAAIAGAAPAVVDASHVACQHWRERRITRCGCADFLAMWHVA